MTKSQPVLCVSAGMLRPKKSDTQLARLHQYLNYGLLGLASILHGRGYQAVVLHGGFEDPLEFTKRLARKGLLDTSDPLLLSLPSSFAIAWANAFCIAIKLLVPQIRIVVGGRWVTATDGAWLRSRLPDVDLVVYGTAESRIERLLNPTLWSGIPMTDRTVMGKTPTEENDFPEMEFSLVEGYLEYQPCVEVSRGCGMGCNFCAEADVPLGGLRTAAMVASELAQLRDLYGGDIRPYFQASYFRPTTQWISDLTSQLEHHDLSIEWRAETRVDGLAPAQIAGLSRAGLKVLDLGLESASPLQLTRMQKTPDPDAYLRRASNLLRACADNGVLTKVNVLLFPGESQNTLEETVSWLQKHRSAIKGVSVGPMIVFRYGDVSRSYMNSLLQLDARPVDEDALDTFGYAHLHLSRDFSHDEATHEAQRVSQLFMNERDYFDLKSFSYFPRSFSYDDFLGVVGQMSDDQCPFGRAPHVAQ